jgi:uncharacterized SAM-dependent methyltransferase
MYALQRRRLQGWLAGDGGRDVLLCGFQEIAGADCKTGSWSTTAAKYPQARQERELFHAIRDDLFAELGAYDAVIDFGPGDVAAVVEKTVPIVRATSAKSYLALDICSDYASAASRAVAARCGISVRSVWTDFHRHLPPLPGARPLGLLLGLGGFNAEDGGKPRIGQLLQRFFARAPNGAMLISRDSNNQADAIASAYSDLDVTHRFLANAEAILGAPGLAATFVPHVRFEPPISAAVFAAQAIENRVFDLDHGRVAVQRDALHDIGVSFKLDDHAFDRLLADAGAQCQRTWRRAGSHISIHLLRQENEMALPSAISAAA